MTNSLIDLLRPVMFRGKVRLLESLIPKSGTRSATVSGFHMQLNLEDYIQRMIYLGTFEREETAIVRRLLKKGATFVDIGANVGYFSLLASSLVGPRGKIVAVEPFRPAYDRLRSTIEANGIENVTAVRCALGREVGTAQLPEPRPDNQAPSLLGAGAGTTVEVRKLDDLLDECRVSHVDLMKIDVEGYEHEVLMGATTLLGRGSIDAFLIEFNQHWLKKAGTSDRDLDALLVGAGYRCTHPLDGKPLSNRLYRRATRA